MNPPNEHDFDFLLGHWRVRHRRLVERLVGCGDWQSFDGHCTVHRLLGGCANVDDNWLDLPGGAYRAASLRSFDATRRCWSIWWLDGRDPGHIGVPVVGRFEQGEGLFFADESIGGRPVRIRFRWSDSGTGSPVWEQAFSADAGQTWELNWTMHFVRPAA